MTADNKALATSFLKLASSGKVREAFSEFIGDGFRHHNPFFEGTSESLLAAMVENTRQNPNKVFEVKRTMAEGAYVVVHSHVKQNSIDFGAAVVHIFRFEKDRIVEL